MRNYPAVPTRSRDDRQLPPLCGPPHDSRAVGRSGRMDPQRDRCDREAMAQYCRPIAGGIQRDARAGRLRHDSEANSIRNQIAHHADHAGRDLILDETFCNPDFAMCAVAEGTGISGSCHWTRLRIFRAMRPRRPTTRRTPNNGRNSIDYPTNFRCFWTPMIRASRYIRRGKVLEVRDSIQKKRCYGVNLQARGAGVS